jgi:flagellin
MSVINTNVKSLAAGASLSSVEKSLSTSMERLSTGLRINSAKDDAAGLAISSRMTSQLRGYAVALRNANDGLSMAQTAEGALGQITNMLQRMRELAVQASNGAMSGDDRNNLQFEVDQLKAEINSIALKTNHNNIKLLDGSATAVRLQTGTNASDSMTVGFLSVQTKDIGQGALPALSSSAVSTSALASGDLLINGVEVGASLAVDDSRSSASPASSAIAKAAAINRVSEFSGVTATVAETVSYGQKMTPQTSGTDGTITINGVTTSTIYTTKDTEDSRNAVIAAINAISTQTGVVAVNTHDDAQGVVLVAKDGRNIVVGAFGGNNLTAASTGITASTTTVGDFTLTSKNGSPIVIGSKIGGSIANAGLSVGTFSPNIAQISSKQRAVAAAGTPAATATSSTTPGLLNGNTMIINDVQIDAAIAGDDNASDTSAESSTKASSAIAIAAAINKKTAITGVKAKAEANVLYGGAFTASTGVSSFRINGETFTTSGGTFNREQLVAIINAKSGVTGVVASLYSDGLKLEAADGRNISLGVNGGTAANIGLSGVDVGADVTNSTVVTHFARVTMSSDKAFSVKSGSESNANFDALGFRRGTFGGSESGVKVADIDVSSQSGANVAITALDAAIDGVISIQARAGAVQNRLEAVVSNLTESTQNMSASRSRILDADYATETTNLARAQIISQAATAMLAQANQSAQTVLALLK